MKKRSSATQSCSEINNIRNKNLSVLKDVTQYNKCEKRRTGPPLSIACVDLQAISGAISARGSSEFDPIADFQRNQQGCFLR